MTGNGYAGLLIEDGVLAERTIVGCPELGCRILDTQRAVKVCSMEDRRNSLPDGESSHLWTDFDDFASPVGSEEERDLLLVGHNSGRLGWIDILLSTCPWTTPSLAFNIYFP